eukprot:TRINITY_DN107876_c0_g1_i1.p1 TRINITY_DN107876_c0_g1~~TRINITY_DN107876_c0_g1_i1.p1  ORF type:complete len:562 (+),score=77.36 TRINITY_DN107876_c0_g1_i1:58-1743(+)
MDNGFADRELFSKSALALERGNSQEDTLPAAYGNYVTSTDGYRSVYSSQAGLWLRFSAMAVLGLLALFVSRNDPAEVTKHQDQVLEDWSVANAESTDSIRLGAEEMVAVIKEYTMTGVNLGGWFCLEDWFFSGESGETVTTPAAVGQGQGRCFPPAVQSMPAPWSSEGVLTRRIADSDGYRFAARMIDGHRRSFIADKDLHDIAFLGLKNLRLPLTWAAFAEALAPLDSGAYGRHDPETDTWIVPDPYYKESAAFATVPRAVLRRFLEEASRLGLKVILDLHTFPGGAQDGTYNGVWPLAPVFWKEKASIGTQTVPLVDTGLWIVSAMVSWLENLDENTLAAIAGVTLMNEPGHMNAKNEYAFADEGSILQWLTDGANIFRKSSLPSRGVKLYVNLISTAFKDWENTVIPWFHSTFSSQERELYVVADEHWYIAWDYGRCDGRSVPGGAVSCDADENKLREVFQGCTQGKAKDMKKHWGLDGGLMALSEISLGTFQEARFACKEGRVLKLFLEEQLASFAPAGIETYFWSWRMPYAPAFEPGWSLKWVTGLENTGLKGACA